MIPRAGLPRHRTSASSPAGEAFLPDHHQRREIARVRGAKRFKVTPPGLTVLRREIDRDGRKAAGLKQKEAPSRALIEEAVEGFRESMSDIARAQTPEVPF